ncbi:MAG: hypothetical protein R3E78_05015 [Burkholderiaceae bacterium]
MPTPPSNVLAAGLGNRALAPMVGLRAPVVPNRGQVLISERVRPFSRYLTLHVRQTEMAAYRSGTRRRTFLI